MRNFKAIFLSFVVLTSCQCILAMNKVNKVNKQYLFDDDYDFTNTSLILFKAIKDGDLNLVKRLVEKKYYNVNEEVRYKVYKGVPISELDLQEIIHHPDGGDELRSFGHVKYPILYAIENENTEIVKYLISKGARLNCYDQKEDTPLHYAMDRCKNIEIFKCLVDAGANVNQKNKFGRTPLHFAAYHENKKAVEYLLKNKASVHASDNSGDTPLYWATFYNNFEKKIKPSKKEIIKLLIEHGAKINIQHWYHGTLLDVVISYGDKDFEKYLIKKGAKTSAKIDKRIKYRKYCIESAKLITLVILATYWLNKPNKHNNGNNSSGNKSSRNNSRNNHTKKHYSTYVSNYTPSEPKIYEICDFNALPIQVITNKIDMAQKHSYYLGSALNNTNCPFSTISRFIGKSKIINTLRKYLPVILKK